DVVDEERLPLQREGELVRFLARVDADAAADAAGVEPILGEVDLAVERGAADQAERIAEGVPAVHAAGLGRVPVRLPLPAGQADLLLASLGGHRESVGRSGG